MPFNKSDYKKTETLFPHVTMQLGELFENTL